MIIGHPIVGLSCVMPIALVTTLITVRAFAIRNNRIPDTIQSWAIYLALAYILYLASAVIVTEALSTLNALNRIGVIISWLTYIAVQLTTLAYLHYGPYKLRNRRPSINLCSGWSALAVSFGAAVVSVIAWIGYTIAPNEPDSMYYHLARVAAWASRGNVNNYPTWILIQLYYGRLDEYLMTQALVLDGTDRLLFVPQLLAFIVSAFLCAGIARLLGGTRLAAIVAFILAASMPVAIMQASGTDNDLFLSSITISISCLAIAAWKIERARGPMLSFIGLGAGLALLTKIDSVLFLFPEAIVLLSVAIRQRWNLRMFIRWSSAGLALMILASLPMIIRNIATFSDPFGLSTRQGLSVSTFQPELILNNAVHNFANDLDFLNPVVNHDVVDALATAGRPLGLDRQSQSISMARWPTPAASPTETGSGSLLALTAVAFSIAALASRRVRQRLKARAPLTYPALAVNLLSLGCIVAILKWQPWGGRFQLMALMPAISAAAVVLGMVKTRAVSMSLLLALSIGSVPISLFLNSGKPIIGNASIANQPRDEQMLRWCPGALAPYQAAVREVRPAKIPTLGYMSASLNGYLYPLWSMLSHRFHGEHVNIEAVAVGNQSAAVGGTAAKPSVVVTVGTSLGAEYSMAEPIREEGYVLQQKVVTACGGVEIYRKLRDAGPSKVRSGNGRHSAPSFRPVRKA